jgi:hypothetical protein
VTVAGEIEQAMGMKPNTAPTTRRPSTATRSTIAVRSLVALLVGFTLLIVGAEAKAQEILLTGPLAGAPAVRNLKLYRKGRVELAPAVSFSLLDQYKRQIFVGARLNYNITDWLAVGGWGAFSPDSSLFQNSTDLVERIQKVNEDRIATPGSEGSTDRRLTAINMGPNFEDQLGTINWIGAPQLTVVPFRGKIAMFQSIFADTDFYLFAGPAFVGVTERADCDLDCVPENGQGTEKFPMSKRTAIAPTFGLGFSFFVNSWSAFGFEWRALPFARNTGGFDNRGNDPDGRFPDRKINSDDREFRFNQLLSVSWAFYLPFSYKTSE